MIYGVLAYVQQFYNWLTTGNNMTPPENAGGAAPVRAQVVQGGGHLNVQQQAPGIQQNAGIPPQNAGLNGVPFPPPPPMNGLNVMNMNVVPAALSLQEALVSREVRALRVRANVRARQGESGHVLARHHPSLTDQQLMDRLLTGLDPEGEPAPTSGVSSRFASEDVFFESLRMVHVAMTSALAKTRRLLKPNLDACAEAEALFLHAAGVQRGLAQAQRTEAYSDLRLAIQSLTTLPDHLPVEWDNVRRCVVLYPKYVINLHQRVQAGTGFYGTGPLPNTVVNGQLPKGLGKQRTMQIYARVQPFNGPADNTLTVFVTPDSPMNAFGRKHSVESWGLITHYPQYHEEGNVRITGSN